MLLYKRDVVNVIKLRILGWENYAKLFTWAQCNHKVFYRRAEEGSESGREDAMTEAEVRLGKKRDNPVGFEDRESGHKPRNRGGL